MEIAITGASGFVGGALARTHLERGDPVRVLVRDPGATICRLPLVTAYRGDLARGDTIPPDFLAGADVLYHCAAELRDERLMEITNVAGTRALARAAAGRVGRWVQVSSASVYGAGRSGTITEVSPLRPDSLYGRTKAESEDVVRSAALAGGFEAVVLRPSNIFGGGISSTALFRLFAMIERGWFFFVGGPGVIMSWIPVENVAAALLACGTHSAAAGRTFNVSEDMPIEQFAAIIAEELGARVPISRLPEAPLRALASLLGWLPGMPLTQARLNALTARAKYSSDRLPRDLAYRPVRPLEEALRELARHWKDGRKHAHE